MGFPGFTRCKSELLVRNKWYRSWTFCRDFAIQEIATVSGDGYKNLLLPFYRQLSTCLYVSTVPS